MSDNLNKSLRLNIIFKYINLALTVASGILLVPFYLKYILTSEYGSWIAVGSFATWFAAMDPGIANLLIQKVAHSHASEDRQALLGYVVAGIVCSSCISVVVLISGLCLSKTLVLWLGLTGIGQEQLLFALRIAIANTAVMILTFTLIGVIQGLHQSLTAGLLATLRSTARIFIVIFLLKSGHGILALPIAELSASVIVLAVTITKLISILRRDKNGQPNFEKFGEFTSLFLYSFGARFGKIITGNIDKVLIARYIGAEQVAVYSITATVPRQAENLINQPIASFRPPLAHLAAEASLDRLSSYIEKMLRWIIWGAGWVLVCLMTLNSDFVLLWVGGDGFAGANISLGLAFLFWVRVWTNSTGAIGFSLGDIKRNSIVEWAYSILLVPALLAGAIFGGLSGIVFVHIVIQLLTMAWYFPWSIWRRLQWNTQSTKGILAQIFYTCIAVALAFWVHPSATNWTDLIIAGLLITAIYFLTLVVASTVFRRELTNLRFFHR